MSKSYWKTTTNPSRREEVQWPTGKQVAIQLISVLVIGMIWSGLGAGFISLTGSRAELEPTEQSPAAAMATETPTVPPTDTPTPTIPTATVTPENPTNTPMSTSTATPENPDPVNTNTPIPTPTATPMPTDAPLPPTDTPEPVEESVLASFTNNVQPIFERRCFNCHGGEKVENDFSVERYETVMKGSWNGPVLEPGNPDGSYLVELIESGEMPNKGPRLLPAEIEAIRAWIEAGAPNN